MAKQNSKKETPTPNLKEKTFATGGFNFRAILLLVIGLVFYANSFQNEYALDDGIVILKNEYVQSGFKGIKKILGTDAYESYYRQMNAKQQLSGGRYRPLSIVTFAIGQQLFGDIKKKPEEQVAFIRHFVNVALYILSIVALFYFLLHFVFENKPDIAFLTALIFLIHPMHTEVVANIKSRDEIMSFLFIILTFISAFKYMRDRRMGQLIGGLLFYFMALLSKEYAITLVVLIPMLFYIKGRPFGKSILAVLPFFAVALIYIIIRLKVVGLGSTVANTDVLNNPYMFATKQEKWATEIEILNHYLRLLFFPHPLSSDYSYSTIPYIGFGNPKVWLAMGLHLAMIVATIVLFIRRNILAFAFAFYLLHLFLVSNLGLDIGATMGERLVYHSSLGFAMAIAMGLDLLLNKAGEEKKKQTALMGVSGVLALACVIIVIPRNADWKNDNTLFIHDADVVPNSVLVNGNAGKAYVDLSEKPENKEHETEYINKAIVYLNRAVSVHTQYVNGYLNLGVCYFKLKDYDKAKEYWDKAKVIFPNNPYLKVNYPLLGKAYMNEAFRIGAKDPGKAVAMLEKAVESDPSNPDLWYNLGGACFTINNFQRAREAWIKALELKPDYEQAKQGLAAIQGK